MTFHNWMTNSPAFRAAPGDAVKLLVFLAKRYNGHNNGSIPMSHREAARDVDCSKNHATKLFRQLVEMGFVTITQPGNFHLKKRHAAMYKLNWLDTRDAAGNFVGATKEFLSWRPPSAMAENSKHGPT